MSVERVKQYFKGTEIQVLEFPTSSATVDLAASALDQSINGFENIEHANELMQWKFLRNILYYQPVHELLEDIL